MISPANLVNNSEK